MNLILFLLCLVMGYLVGSIPFALVIGKLFYHTDVREHGSGNLGGTNAGRVLGSKAGAAVMILDIGKVVLCIWIASHVSEVAAAWTGLACCIGHCWPVFANFHGGKAVSTVAGYLVGISWFVLGDFLFFAGPLVMFLVMLWLYRQVSLASISTGLCVAVEMTVELWYGGINEWCLILSSWCMAALVVYRHWANIQRTRKGEEKTIKWMGK